VAGSIDAIRKAIVDGAPGDAIGALALPETMRAAFVRKDEQEMFRGMDPTAKDPRKSIHVDEVPTPPLGPNECLIAVMASAINYNTVWSSIFDPVPTFAFLEKLGLESDLGARHALDYHILGSDASGVILKTGPGVTRWKPGDQVTVHCNYVDMEAPTGHDDSMLDPNQRIWGFESNFGGLADIAMVKANQLMPKPRHLTWEEAACLGLVSSAEKCQLLQSIGVEHIIDRKAEGYNFWNGDEPDPKEWRRFGKQIRSLVGEDPDIVFEHPGRQTFGASVFVAKRGGTIVTCASTSGYMHTYDNRYLWMHLKRIIGSHFANYREAWEANRLAGLGKIHPILSTTYPLEETGEAAYEVHQNLHTGKVGIRVMAEEDGLGVADDELRARHLERIEFFRRFD
jgi:crotonyl-CoA reductase